MGFLDDIATRFRSLVAEADTSVDVEEAALRRAIAGLLVRAQMIDGEETIEEAMKLVDLLKARFGLSDSEASELIRQAEQDERETNDLFKFTRVVTEQLDRDGRIKVLEMMFEIVAADGEIDVFEENLMTRGATLLRLPDYFRDELRPRIFAMMGR